MAYLMNELEVSQASVKRDLDFLRDLLDCPLEWDRKKRGWVIRDDLTEGGRFELPGVWFDSSEVFALLTMLHLLEGVQPGLLEEHVGPLKTRRRSMLAEGTKSTVSCPSTAATTISPGTTTEFESTMTTSPPSRPAQFIESSRTGPSCSAPRRPAASV